MKILLADDHHLVREGVRLILEGLAEDVSVLEAFDLAGVMKLLQAQIGVDLAVIDLAMPGMDGFAGLYEIRALAPALPVVILSSSEAPLHVRAALEAGAAGYIPKSASSNTLLSALRLVLDGGVYAPRLADMSPPASRKWLTARQSQVLALIAEGHSNGRIAEQLHLTEATVKGHVTGIFASLGVSSRVQALDAARRLGALPPDVEPRDR